MKRLVLAVAAVSASLAVVACGGASGDVGGPDGLPALPGSGAADVHSVAQLVAALPDPLRRRPVLLFESRSPQGATPDAPRVILASPDARQVVAFSGTRDSVDLMTFDDAAAAFVFREVTFRAGGGGPPAMQVSEANPERCRACHGTPARPIWDAYPVWPGAYGEVEGLPLSQAEHDALARFEALGRREPRYASLDVPRQTPATEAEARYTGASTSSPNARLGVALGALVAGAIARELRTAPGFEARRYALLEALSSGCDVATTRGPGYAAFAFETARVNAEQAAYKSRRVHGRAAPPPGAAPGASATDASMTRLRYVAETELGVSTRGWTMALEKGTYDFALSDRGSEGLPARLFVELAADDARAMELAWNGADRGALCEHLAQRDRLPHPDSRSYSRGTLRASSPAPPTLAPEIEGKGDLLARCAGCHERGVGPHIPFAHPEELRRVLAPALLEAIRYRLSPEAGAERMPMVENPPREAQEQLMGELGRLAAAGPP
jgi:hypothetical protein